MLLRLLLLVVVQAIISRLLLLILSMSLLIHILYAILLARGGFWNFSGLARDSISRDLLFDFLKRQFMPRALSTLDRRSLRHRVVDFSVTPLLQVFDLPRIFLT